MNTLETHGIHSSTKPASTSITNTAADAPRFAGATVVRDDGFPLTLGPVPTSKAPAPPVGFVYDPRQRWLIKRRPSDRQRSDAREAAAELTALSDHVRIFGSSQAPLAASLERASDWRDHAEAARAWLHYVELQSDRAWDDALHGLNGIRDSLAYWTKREPALATTLPALSRVVMDGALRSRLGRRTQGVKKAKATVKAKADAYAEYLAAENAKKGANEPHT